MKLFQSYHQAVDRKDGNIHDGFCKVEGNQALLGKEKSGTTGPVDDK
jgi:hypothetical protein